MNKYDGNTPDGDGGDCGFFALNPVKFSLLASVLGILLIDNLSVNQQNSLGNFLENVGQNLLTAAAQAQTVQQSQQNQIRRQIQSLKEQIAELEEELDQP